VFQRLLNLLRGLFGRFVSGVERQNPEALLELEKENLRQQIARYNQGLASHAGLCERLIGQIRKLEADERDLRAKAAAHLRAGNREAAGQFALRLEMVSRELKENQEQAIQAEATYKNLVKTRDVAVQAAQAKIETLRHSINDLKIEKASAEMSEMASGMISEIGGAGDTLDRLHQMVEEERTRAAGRARLARDSVQMTQVELKETEQKALADQALADFAAREGIPLESTPVSGEAEAKKMGPTKESQ
jgi:phage shock protein A